VGLAACALLGACRSDKTGTPPAEAAASPTQDSATAQGTAPAASAKKTYGEPLTAQAPVELTALVGSPEAHAGKTVVVEGVVRRACSAKGCWLELASGQDADAPGFRVTFKDYGFFIPTDSAGARARVQGVVEVTEVKKSHVEHLEGEGATFDKKHPDGTATEVRVVATGVELEKSS
jgi:hypothetical protein